MLFLNIFAIIVVIITIIRIRGIRDMALDL